MKSRPRSADFEKQLEKAKKNEEAVEPRNSPAVFFFIWKATTGASLARLAPICL
jgi:hypothetical protein